MKKNNDVTVKKNRLLLGPGLEVSFQRTLRIPDDGKRYPLLPGLGDFPLRRVDDYADRVPREWRRRGGVFLPMYQREAMWIRFSGQHWKPRAVKVGIGKVCAITGKRWSGRLAARKQNYVVTPPQPWLDGICAGKGVIRQFVAMPLGMGYTVEGQITGEERFGGVQLKVFEPMPGHFPDSPPNMYARRRYRSAGPASMGKMKRAAGSMGLAAGGRMKQKIYPDPYGIDTWNEDDTNRVFIHIVNSELWREITGEEPPATPVTAKSYRKHGLPWFDLYDESLPTLKPTAPLKNVQSVSQLDESHFGAALMDDDDVDVGPVKKLLVDMAKKLPVRDGDW